MSASKEFRADAKAFLEAFGTPLVRKNFKLPEYQREFVEALDRYHEGDEAIVQTYLAERPRRLGE